MIWIKVYMQEIMIWTKMCHLKYYHSDCIVVFGCLIVIIVYQHIIFDCASGFHKEDWSESISLQSVSLMFSLLSDIF